MRAATQKKRVQMRKKISHSPKRQVSRASKRNYIQLS
jgi:hypothetical protein